MLQHKNMQAHFSSCTTTKKENITPIKIVHQSLAVCLSVQITQAPKRKQKRFCAVVVKIWIKHKQILYQSPGKMVTCDLLSIAVLIRPFFYCRVRAI